MPGKINLFNLGNLGIDQTNSPIHGQDGSFVSTQNAVPNMRGEHGGLAKRDGLAAINGSATGGTITGIIDVNLQLITTRTYFIGYNQSSINAGWGRSTSAFTSMTGTFTPPHVPSERSIGFAILGGTALTKMNSASIGNRFYWGTGGAYETVATGAVEPALHAFDGVTDEEVAKIPHHPSVAVTSIGIGIIDQFLFGTKLYLAVCDDDTLGVNSKGRVLEYDTVTRVLKQVGEAFGAGTGEITGGFPSAILVANGFIWVGLYGGVGTANSKILRIRPTSETTWTVDRTPALGGVGGLMEFQGKIYATHFRVDAAVASTVQVRDSAGAWTTSFTNDYASVNNNLNIPTVFNNNLYVIQYGAGANPTKVKKFDGTTWTTDYTHADQPWGISSLVHNNTLFFALGNGYTGPTILRNTGSGWTGLTVGGGGNGFSGPLAVLES